MKAHPSSANQTYRSVALLAFALAFACPRVARADDPTAETLYQEGRRAAQAKDWAVACTKFKESHDREPAPGTLLNLADCEENLGKWLDAIAHFGAASRLFRAGDERVAYAKQRAAAIERRLPRLTLRLHPTSPTGTEVERDGVALGVAGLGSRTPVDPGEHTLVVRAPGRSEVRSTLRLAEGEMREIVLTVGTPLPAGETAKADAPKHVETVAAPSEVLTSQSPSALRTAGFVSLGVGAVGVGVGLLGALITINAKSDADAHCPATGCTGDGLDAQSRGKTWGAISTAGFVAGGVGLAAGAGLLLFAPASQTTGVIAARPAMGGAELRWIASF